MYFWVYMRVEWLRIPCSLTWSNRNSFVKGCRHASHVTILCDISCCSLRDEASCRVLTKCFGEGRETLDVVCEQNKVQGVPNRVQLAIYHFGLVTPKIPFGNMWTLNRTKFSVNRLFFNQGFRFVLFRKQILELKPRKKKVKKKIKVYLLNKRASHCLLFRSSS